MVPLSPRLLTELHEYWRTYRPTTWLFPGPKSEQPLGSTTIQKCCTREAKQAGLTKRVTPHTLRHSYATGLLKAGVDLLTIQRLLGHRSFSTTLIYLHVRRPHLESIHSPLDLLPLEQCPRFADPSDHSPSPSEERTRSEAACGRRVALLRCGLPDGAGPAHGRRQAQRA